MHDTFKLLLANQYEASLATLAHCVELCPALLWNMRIAKYPLNLVAFHTLFFADYYLGDDAESFAQQSFHQENRELFADYEQLQDEEPTTTYTREQLKLYGGFCRQKALSTLANETAESLTAPARFARRNFSRAELHVYNIRHIQHHAAQIMLRLRMETNLDFPWIGSGWREPSIES